MKQLNGVYTQSYNKRHRKVGHIFQGRYKAIVIQKESHLLEVSRYVVLNPVRAKAVENPEGWEWSSYGATAGIKEPYPCLTSEWILGQFDKRKRLAEKKYREFVESGKGEQGIWKEVKGQSILGEDDFVERLIGYVKGYEEIKEIPKSQRYMNRPALDELFGEDTLLDKSMRNEKIGEAVNKHGYSQKEAADHLAIHYSTVSRLINRNQYVQD